MIAVPETSAVVGRWRFQCVESTRRRTSLTSAGSKPRATIAVLARHPEQADRYYAGLRRADVPALRRVRAQEFSFRPGVEVTDIRQTKGLEFDYVLIPDAASSVYGDDAQARRALYVAITRTSQQLLLSCTGTWTSLLAAPAASSSMEGGTTAACTRAPRPPPPA